VREGDWKLVWQTALPSRIELFNLAQDPSEKNNLAEKNPQKVAELQQRIQKLAQEAAQPLFLKDALGATKHVLFGSVATPDQEKDLEMQPLTVRYLAKNARRDSISCFYTQAPDDSHPSCVFCSPPAIFPLPRTEDYGEDSAGFGERSWPTLKISEGWLVLS